MARAQSFNTQGKLVRSKTYPLLCKGTEVMLREQLTCLTSPSPVSGLYMRFGEVVKKAPHFSLTPPHFFGTPFSHCEVRKRVFLKLLVLVLLQGSRLPHLSFLREYGDAYPRVAKAIRTMLVMPPNSSAIERGYSVMKEVISPRRSCLSERQAELCILLACNIPSDLSKLPLMEIQREMQKIM